MIVGGRYELAEVVVETAESRTLAAREMLTGRAVLVHQILAAPPGGRKPSLHELAERCLVGTGGVLDRLTDEGTEYLVTETREAFHNLRGALEQAVLVPPPAPIGSGEDRFTRVGAWRVPAGSSTPSTPAVSGEPSVSGIFSSTPQPASPDLKREAGEFTRMFHAPEEAPSPPVPPPPAVSVPGEFTRMLQTPDGAPPPTAPPPPAASEPGDFTRMFRAPAESQAPPLPRPAAGEPGEFTRYFQSPLASRPLPEGRPTAPPQPPATPPLPAAPEPGEYTRLFRMPSTPAPPATGSGATHVFVTPATSSPPPSVDQGPSDFTRIIQSRPEPALEPRPAEAPKAPATAHATKEPRVPVWLVVFFTALAALAVFMILFFALRR